MPKPSVKSALKGAVLAWDRLNEVFNTIVGQPDYDEYVKHIKKHHPDITPLSKKEFLAKAADDRGKRPRCC